MFSLKTSERRQVLFAVVEHIVEGLKLEALLTLKNEKEKSDLLGGYTETNSIYITERRLI
jgi:hypothetical protein